MILIRRVALLALLIAAALIDFSLAAESPEQARGRIFVLVVADGLRPDFVTRRDTPNLDALADEGVRFLRHRSVFPTLTMVNAAALATGASPAVNGIVGNMMWFGPALAAKGAAVNHPDIKPLADRPARLHSSARIATLNLPNAFAGRLLALDTVVQEVGRIGGYVAVIGKRGPAYLLDNRVVSVRDGRDAMMQPRGDYLFVSEDYAAPPEITLEALRPFAGGEIGAHEITRRDAYFAQLAIDRALPAAKAASERGKPALVVLWFRNPDATQHYAGLGTLAALDALGAIDREVGRVRTAIATLGIGDRTDLMVVSDHGFATIFLTVDVAALLAAAGLKQSRESTEVIVVPNGGADLVYLDRAALPTREERREQLQKIVNFALAQEWCGAIFSSEPAPADSRGRAAKPYLGWIDGTFNQAAVGIYHPPRAPDLIISFREISDRDNRGLTGPDKPAFALGANGQTAVRNRSAELVRPIKGVLYADVGAASEYTTGMGMHGGAGVHQIVTFAAAVGPSFSAGLVSRIPTGNTDVAPTIVDVLGVLPNVGPGGAAPTGRVLREALSRSRAGAPRVQHQTISATAVLQGMRVNTRLKLSRVEDRVYLDDSSVERIPHGSSP